MDRAAAEAFARPRSTLRWLDATTTLRDFALVTFDVDPGRLTAVLPSSLLPEVRTLDDGRARGFVSAVSFRDVDFRFAVAPWFKVSFFQTNYRAYVSGPDGVPKPTGRWMARAPRTGIAAAGDGAAPTSSWSAPTDPWTAAMGSPTSTMPPTS